ncbi:phosphotransferase [Streptomyces cucumeris]|uniref:phosphotransferase n=1 Tax=Streptomyces cucumeris TaxID=2962890 RepID=UPI003D723869
MTAVGVSGSGSTCERLWALVREHTGEQYEVRPTSRGKGSDVTALVTCERGSFFVKACRNRPGGRRASIVRERMVNPSVRAVSPALRWNAEDDAWIVLGFEVVEGRSSDFSLGSSDLPAVVGVLNSVRGLVVPDEVGDWRETRWHRFADEGDRPHFLGDTLLFTDANPDNVMIGDRRTWLVDWSWPTVGAAFIAPACLVVQLIAAGHTAEQAEAWVVGCRGWAMADPAAIDAFAIATVRMNRGQAERFPEAGWLGDMAEAAHLWAVHRGVSEAVTLGPSI